MKHLLSILLISIVVSGRSQTLIRTSDSNNSLFFKAVGFTLSLKKKVQGKTCDSCRVDGIFYDDAQLSYFVINARNTNLPSIRETDLQRGMEGYMDTEPSVKKKPVLKKIIRHTIATRDIYLDFLTGFRQKDTIALRNLQCKVFRNQTPVTGWVNIGSLPADSAIEAGVIKSKKSGGQLNTFDTYKTPLCSLNVGDSMVVLVDNTLHTGSLVAIVVKREVVFPQFDIVQFSSGQSLQKIVNNEIGQYGKRIDAPTLDYQVMPGNLAVLRFSDHPEHRSNLEYSFASAPEKWQAIENIDAAAGYSMFSFIIINAPEPGHHEVIYLRYKGQRETVQTITITTKAIKTYPYWPHTAAGLVLTLLLLGSWYYVRQRRHKKQLTALANKNEDIETRLQLLNGQLNPHFLFNSLNAIQLLVNKNESENASAYIASVAAFLRTIMETGQKTFISLLEEIELEESYIRLEQKRRSFRYNLHIKDGLDLSKVEFPPLLLQPVIENCIRHGMGNAVKDPYLLIEVDHTQKDLTITIRDNGVGFDPLVESSGHGLLLIRKRMAILNEKLDEMKMEMFAQSAPGNGASTTFTFKNWL